MLFYLATIIVIALLMGAMLVHVLRYSGFNREQKGWFTATFVAVAFCALAEFAVHSGYYNPKFKVFLTILTVIQFGTSPTLAMLFSGALGLKYQRKIGIGYYIASLLVQIICAPFGAVFYFTDEGYVRGDYFFVYEIFFIISLLYLMVCLFIVGKRFKNRDLATIIMIFVVLLSGIIPMAFFNIHVSYYAISISACLCYIYYNDLIQEDTKQALVENQAKMTSMQNHIVTGLASLIESRDTDTGEHVIRTSYYCKTLAENARKDGIYLDELTDEFIELLYQLAPLHDVGKIVVSDRILTKPGKLTPEEFEEMKKHAEMGGVVIRKILDGITDEKLLEFASDIATYHHERWDGTGYCKGLKGNKIPLAARIMAIADVYDALTSVRCYKDKMPPEEAFKIIKEEAGTHFDPKLVKVLLKHKEQYLEFLKDDNK